jgi:hypothetical protein
VGRNLSWYEPITSRELSKRTEEIGEEPQDYQSLKDIQTEYLPSTVIEGKNKPTCSRDFEEPKATYISGDFCLN